MRKSKQEMTQEEFPEMKFVAERERDDRSMFISELSESDHANSTMQQISRKSCRKLR